MRSTAVAVLLALLLAACGTTDDPDGAAGGEADPTADEPDDGAPTTFRIAVGVDLDTFDPAGTTTTTVANMVDYTVEPLVQIDEEGAVYPQLATDWEISEDALTYTFQLREGVEFHDGTPFDAEAVVFTFERLLDEEVTVPIRAPFQAIESITATGSHEVAFQLSQPFPPLIAALSFSAAAIISPASAEAGENTYLDYREPVGTGPYTFGEYREGERFVVERFAGYWGEMPYYDTVQFQIVPEAATRVSLLRAGQIDMMILPPVSEIPALEDDSDIEVLMAPGNRVVFISINNNQVPDPRVRQALNHAVDKESLVSNVLFGAADPLDAPMHSSLFGHCSVGSYDYDPDRARALLAEAGAEDLELRFISPTGRYIQDFEVSQAISGFLSEIGVTATVETMDWPSYVGRITAAPDEQEQDLHLLGWAPSYMDAFQAMVMFESSSHPPAGLATAFYDNPAVDTLLADAAQEVDEDTRQDMYCEASRLVWEDAPWIFLHSQRFPIAYRAGIEGVSYRPNESFNALYARPSE
jgi:peptide/nickel transport system substrate-binding protein